jgi:valyl-tRNA synthetase
MPHDLPKTYDPTSIEDKWAEYWVRENLFSQSSTQPTPAPAQAGAENAENDSPAAPAFTILLPPPNVTGRLHMGHMLNQTEMDILSRWHRMRGEPTLWLPGTDHAGIATQMMVEKQVLAEGTTRQQMGREAFLERVWSWRKQYGGAILEQMKRLGASVDWQREYFTMDANLSVAVREAFTRLYAQGLIYRGAYVVNWCPGCQTAISDLEVVHEEVLGHLWEIKYPVVNPDSSTSDDKDTGVPNDRSSSLGWLTIATTRPETMLGDVAVAIHPEDERYTHLHGKNLILPLTGREIPIVLDEWVSRDFGTGAVKITPAHDANDFALGQRHHLPSINIFDETAHINQNGGVYAGLSRFEARKRILADLEALGLLGTIRDHKLSIGRCDRSKDIIEPRLSTQWFVAVNKQATPGTAPRQNGQTMAQVAVAAVTADATGRKSIQFTPSMYEKTYLNWMANIYDWCISRQLWWGHRIPAWHCAACHQITVPQPGGAPDPISCAHCSSSEITQETDVLDTWFSSGLLPISVFGWPFLNQNTDPAACHPERAGAPTDSSSSVGLGSEGPATPIAGAPGLASPGSPTTGPRRWGGETWERGSIDFQTFYPTSLLVTGFDILFFWVERMIMLGAWFALDIPMPDGSLRELKDAVPFREVYIHALVRDANREKMSKTKGNVIDPIEIVKKYGTDAVRFTLASMASPGTDIAFNEARTEGYRAFANKIWNAARFIFMNVDKAIEAGIAVDRSMLGGTPLAITGSPLEAIWIVEEFQKTTKQVNDALANYRYDDAANAVYQFFWATFCDWYLEIAKVRLDFSEDKNKFATRSSLTTLLQTFEASLRLLSPFMPFITEELWSALYEGNAPYKSIALAEFPTPTSLPWYTGAPNQMPILQELITGIRTLRKQQGVEEKATVDIHLAAPVAMMHLFEQNSVIIQRLAKVRGILQVGEIARGVPQHLTNEYAVALDYRREIDIPAERERLTREIGKLEKNILASERQLGNEGFMAKAPAHIVEGLKKQDAENRDLLAKAKAALAALET